MYILKIEQNSNGTHTNQSWSDDSQIPEGYAKISEELGNPYTLENYPYGDITVELIDSVPTVVNWSPLPKEDYEEPEEPETIADSIHKLASSGIDSI